MQARKLRKQLGTGAVIVGLVLLIVGAGYAWRRIHHKESVVTLVNADWRWRSLPVKECHPAGRVGRGSLWKSDVHHWAGYGVHLLGQRVYSCRLALDLARLPRQAASLAWACYAVDENSVSLIRLVGRRCSTTWRWKE